MPFCAKRLLAVASTVVDMDAVIQRVVYGWLTIARLSPLLALQVDLTAVLVKAMPGFWATEPHLRPVKCRLSRPRFLLCLTIVEYARRLCGSYNVEFSRIFANPISSLRGTN